MERSAELVAQTVLVALGIDERGQKHPLGLCLGVTENAVVCAELLNKLVTRELDPQQPYLFLIRRQGPFAGQSRRFRKAIGRPALSGARATKRPLVPSEATPSEREQDAALCVREHVGGVAKKRLLQLVAHLTDEHPDAAASLREGLEETLTLKDMKLPLALERKRGTTNPFENLNGCICRITRNVKRWRDGSMVKRWVATSVLES